MNLHNLLTVESLFSNLIVFIVAVLLTNWWHKRNKKVSKPVNEASQPIRNETPIHILRTYREDTKRFGFAYLEKHTPAIIQALQKQSQYPSAEGISQEELEAVIATLKGYLNEMNQIEADENEQEKYKIMVLNYVNKTLIRWRQLSQEVT
ncbi:hypothetical protein [Enterococcus pallens]|uniref:Uncharacterized protein n=1 Tax=Enterococcus pallens ATCC BAA-351 TaxID=1158607 RepID=R2Q5T4_9ENTE|nr:hypothetical protein [Enterococcus pallens]EOH91887.1 hypothetical protein UAU_03189 [Enterococcus pallens ATCC BAA-351]EOU25314.1 hypothetical protein I588_01302 [Enterococcus pallens ATCC BAA-351]